MQEKKATLIEHLEELRRRLLVCIIALVLCGVISYTYIDRILFLFTRFVDRVVFISPQEAFVTYIKIALFSGMLLASPVIMFQVWRFVEGAFTEIERKYFLAYWVSSFFLFMGGLAFCYFLILPWAIKFFLSFQTDKIIPMITFSNLATFYLMLLISFGILFELPVVIVFLSQVGIIGPSFLRKQRKYAILAIFIVSAVITPTTDPVTQTLLAIPLVGLYEISILLSSVVKSRPELRG
ncbi:MAG: twin-arginine translocase subunit TatC [Candidatus Omnitrophica bacterium CG07_land_8_20_14_0_80_42_15]|uniref:Sec-independent protein translocase protein TatC n=1 Tax=Candidatus Aquitaenariimonas noxiae TaxID=1974741 RepID=A0A2J0KZJ9_9BACT|nr:MAG: twin-arginine translocase subunit TatC [Candidatus Omnitrophica bacterium CG07_land_8_20_14_0_80_42_15]